MFDSREYWEKRYSSGDNSGSGSYGRLAQFKARIINDFCYNHNVSSIVEWGCGDGNNCKMFTVEKYVGYDVSKTAIEICSSKIKIPNRQFIKYDGEKVHSPEMGELSLSMDVLYHLIEDEMFDNYMFNLFNSSERYVAIYSFDGELESSMASHVKYREHSNYVSRHFPNYRKLKIIENDFKRTEQSDPDTTSWCDFFFYERIQT
ncbi:methyltransferase domain-containing protein [Butyrivibrio sp. TB]|jgi:hypothetical protein|uniref:methyltransferase domain-containing protein n=1 Tax=Butyrivibrio sp. TB TaxID=1520809 RepID=UPI0008D77554|nr:class I SAM-dependent methyltransferase [Butyrivibrio sp. TB]SEQ15205.1 hypothetical protein SAMN02910382_02176 [Butyrivibrio sp. TB]